MKKKIIVISDYMEGQPVVASVRYAGLMKYFNEEYTVVTINDNKYGSSHSQFASLNYKYTTLDSALTQSMQGGTTKDKNNALRNLMEQFLRRKWIMSLWRNYKYSKFKFDKMNKSLFRQLDYLLVESDVLGVFVTVPDVYGLYILDYIKQKSPHLPAIIEIRDIINHNIGEGIPRLTFRRAEQMITELADGVIALSQGIYQYYQNQNKHLDIQLIKDGYDEQHFMDCEYHPIPLTSQHLTLAHIGSIYKGRNIKSLAKGLLLFHKRTGIDITFNIVGLLDQQALEDINSVELSGTGVNIHIQGSMQHERAVALLKSADIAVILTHTKGSDYAIPGKTFEYIGACKPILAVTEDRELVSIVHGHYGECSKHDAENIANGLEHLIQQEYDFSNRGMYSRKSQATQMMCFMDKKIQH